jgi:hypothetical protein
MGNPSHASRGGGGVAEGRWRQSQNTKSGPSTCFALADQPTDAARPACQPSPNPGSTAGQLHSAKKRGLVVARTPSPSRCRNSFDGRSFGCQRVMLCTIEPWPRAGSARSRRLRRRVLDAVMAPVSSIQISNAPVPLALGEMLHLQPQRANPGRPSTALFRRL